jgi:hypothetical protein
MKTLIQQETWRIDRVFLLVPAQQYVGGLLIFP